MSTRQAHPSGLDCGRGRGAAETAPQSACGVSAATPTPPSDLRPTTPEQILRRIDPALNISSIASNLTRDGATVTTQSNIVRNDLGLPPTKSD